MQTLAELLELQSGVVSRRQVLALSGESDATIRRRLRRRTWVPILPGVYVAHTGPPTWLSPTAGRSDGSPGSSSTA